MRENAIEKIISIHKDADLFLHLGDGAERFLLLCRERGLAARAVRGNCDISFFGQGELEASALLTLDGVKIFMTHGNLYSVDSGLTRLVYAARERDADIVLFGHTHVSMCQCLYGENDEKPLYVMNPGSCERPRDGRASYGIIDIAQNGIFVTTAPVSDRES